MLNKTLFACFLIELSPTLKAQELPKDYLSADFHAVRRLGKLIWDGSKVHF